MDWKFCHKGKTVILSEGIFNSYRTTIMHSFFCILFVWQFYLRLNIYFVNFMLKYLNLQSKTGQFGSSQRLWHHNVWGKLIDVNTDVVTSCMWVVLFPSPYPCKTFPCTGQRRGNSCQVCRWWFSSNFAPLTWLDRPKMSTITLKGRKIREAYDHQHIPPQRVKSLVWKVQRAWEMVIAWTHIDDLGVLYLFE